MNKLSNLFFDLDGTLTDSQESIFNCFRYALTRLGCPDPGDLHDRGLIGPPLRAGFANLLDSCDDTLIEKAVNLYRERYEVACLSENRLYPGIPALISELQANSLRLFVVTTKAESFAIRIVDHFFPEKPFEAVFGTSAAGSFNDKGEHIEVILRDRSLNRTETLMIGDRQDDVLAGRANGIKTLAVTYGYGSLLELQDSSPDYLCGNVDEMLETISGLTSR
jgi:phosphoglycolate phosphatase